MNKEKEFFKAFKNVSLSPGGLTELDYIDISKLIDEFQPQVIADVGCWTGTSTCIMARKDVVKKVYAVDWFKGLNEGDMEFSGKFFDIKSILKENLRVNGFDNKVEVIDNISVEAAKQFDDFSLDMVFIDANHAFEFVMADIQAWYGKVKQGGIISGHDFDRFIAGLDDGSIEEPNMGCHTGVIKAVQCFFRNQGNLVKKYSPHGKAFSSVWYAQKPK